MKNVAKIYLCLIYFINNYFFYSFNNFSKMTKFFTRLCILTCLVLSVFTAQAQLTGTKTIPGDYATVALAVSALNTNGVGAGGVTISITAAGSETNTAATGISLTATGTAGNPIIIANNSGGVYNIIGAAGGTGTPGTVAQDGIFRMLGSDYVTLDGLTFTDNNTALPACMEYGIGFFKASVSNGCQNNLVQNCTVSLNKLNNATGTAPMVDGSVGILVINALATAQTTALVPLSAAGSNSFNAFNTNTVKNTNIGFALIGYVDASPFALADTGNDIGGNKPSFANQILNFGGGATANPAAGVRTLAQYALNVSNNILNNNDGTGANHGGTIRGIYINTAIGASTTINKNTITLKFGGTTSQVSCIENVSGASGTANTVAITNNTIQNCTNTAATTSSWYGIFNSSATAANLTVTGNKFINNATNATSGITYGIYNNAACPTSITMDNNEISHNYVGAAANTGASNLIWNAGGIAGATGTNISMQNNIIANINHNAAVTNSGILYFVYNTGANKTLNISDNKFNALVLNHSGTEYPIYNSSASALSMLISGNMINTSWTRTQASGTFYGIYSGGGSLVGCSYNITNNNFSNITSATTGTGTFSMIYDFNGSAAAPYTRKNISNNTFENIDYTTTGTCYGMMYGYYFGDGGVTGSGSTISNNIYRNIKVSGTMYTCYFSTPNSAFSTINMFGNTFTGIQNKNAASTASMYLSYLSGTAGGGMKYYKNKVTDFENKGTGITYGLYTAAAMNYEIYNNIVGDIRSGGYTSATAPYLGLSAFYLSSGSTVNLTNNTVNLNTTSTGANFTSACVYSTATPSAVNLRNNVFVNTSTPKGAGVTAVIQRAAAALTNYGTASNNNMLYAGVPSATNLLYYDGTTGYQTLASLAPLAPREIVSVSEAPLFLSTVSTDPTFLHYNTTIQTGVESGGAAYALVTDDFDGQPRQGQAGYAGTGLAIDMGADEFEGLPKFTCTGTFAQPSVTSSQNPVCFGSSSILSIATVPPGTGMAYKWQSSPLGLGTFTDISGAITTSYNATPTVPTEYRIVATCGDGSPAVTSTSTPVDFTYALTGTADGTRCGTGPVTLQAAGTGTTISWFTTPTGGASIGAGNPFNTPIISATTTYYAAATGISNGSVQVGTGTGTQSGSGYGPFMCLYENARYQYLIKGSELIALGLNAGNISSVAFNVTGNAGTSSQTNYTVKMGSTTLSALPATGYSTPTSAYTNVYGPVLLPAVAVGWKTLTFSTPYVWDGSSNILMDICYDNDPNATCASCYSSSVSVQQTTTSYISVAGGFLDNAGACGLNPTAMSTTYQTLRPNMQFNGLIACSSSRSPVVATVSAALPFSVSGNRTICNNAIASMDVSSTLSNFDSYTWTPVTNLYTDAACTVAYVAGANASTVYVKGSTPGTTTYTCNANNTVTTCADIKTVGITILPAAVTVAATPNTPICVSGAVVLALTPATGFPTGSLQWQSDASGSFANVTTGTGGTTTNYTSALLTAPTNFQILVLDDASTTCTSTVHAIQVNNPTVATTVPGTRCGTGTVTLGATPSTGAAIKWYAASTGGAALASGNTYTTPSISNSTNYFAESSVGLTTSPITTAPGASVGGTLGSGSFQTSTATGLYFDVLSTSGSTLKTVDIYPSATAALGSAFKIDVRAGTSTTSTIIATYSGVTTVQNPTAVSPAPTIAQTVPVNFVLPQGSYNITFTTNPNTFRDAVTATATFPKTAPGVASITGATLSGYWYYFYNFVFESGCTGPRVPVLATVAAPPALTATGDQTVCNGASKTLTVTSTLGDFDTYNWSPVTNLFADAAATIPVLATDNLSTVHVKGTTAGVTAYTLSSSNTTTGCANSAPINVALLPVSTVTASPASICVSGSTTVKVTPFNAATFGAAAFQWEENSSGAFVNISGANGDTYVTPSITTGRDYKVIIKDGVGGNVCNTPSVNIAVNSPTVLSSTPATRCGTGTLALTATADATSTLKWYGLATGGSVLGTGTTFTTPSIAATTTYYVAAAAGGAGGGTQQVSSNGTGTSFTSTQNGGLIFDLLTEVTLNSIDIFSTAAGTCTITIFNAAGTLLHTTPALPMVAGPSTTPQTMPIGIVLQAATGYRILVSNTGNALGYGTGVFPTPMGNGVGNIVNGALGTGTSTLNYFVYNMNTSTGCASPRVPVVATVTPAAAVSLAASPTSICAGQSSTLSASSSNSSYSYTYTPSGASGSTASVSPTASTTYTVNAIDGAGCAASATATVAVNPLPGAVTASPSLTNANIGDIVTLTATGGSSAGSGQIGTGTSVTSTIGITPFSTFYEGARSQYLLTAAELTTMGATAGSITSVSWNVTVASAYAMTNFAIKMAPTANTVIGSTGYGTPSSPFVTVFSNPLEPIVSVGWKKYTFTSPFAWDGTSNVLIDVCHDNDINATCTNCYGTSGTVEYTATGFNSVYGSYADNAQSCGVTATSLVSTFTNRPNMKFDYGLNAPITWTPATALYTNAAATTPYVAGTPATTVYSKPTTSVNYLAVATTAAGCTTSSPAVVKVDECYMNAGISNLSVGPNALPSQCEGLTFTYYGSGTTYNIAIEWGTNTLSHNNAAASIKKFSAPPSIIVGTNATFIQPMIWNMDVAGNQPSGPVKTRIYYDPADTLAARNAAISFLASSTPTAHITKQVWFKSLSGEFDPSNTVFQSGIGNIEPTSVIELTPTYGSYMSGGTTVHYAEFLVDHFSGGSSAISAGDLQSPLPVVFKNFKGLATGKTNTLTWEASVQANTKEYRLERSVNGRDWTLISAVAANATLRYSSIDENPVCQAYYRVIGVDNDGKTWHTQVVTITRRCDKFNITSAYPVPTDAKATVQYESVGDANVNIRITDLMGRVLATNEMIAKDGFNEVVVDLSAYASGTYFVTLNNGSDQITQRLIKE